MSGYGIQMVDHQAAAERELAAWRELQDFEAQTEAPASPVVVPRPINASDSSQNPLRPTTWGGLIGQENTKRLLQRVVECALLKDEPLDHMLMVGPSGTGKTTLSIVVANELGRRLFVMSAPVDHDQLLALRTVARDGDILLVDEIHMWAGQDRRGRSSSSEPECAYSIMEDRTIATEAGLEPFPAITLIGATTDVGRLPEAFRNRFPLQPRLEPYSEQDMATIAGYNAHALGLEIEVDAVERFAKASRSTPRVVNSYLRNASALCTDGIVRDDLAAEVVTELNRTQHDGLTEDMARMLVFLLTNGRRESAAGEISYVAGVNTLATALGMSRDSKSIVLYVEPELIRRGLVSVGHGGRRLTERGIERARELTT